MEQSTDERVVKSSFVDNTNLKRCLFEPIYNDDVYTSKFKLSVGKKDSFITFNSE